MTRAAQRAAVWAALMMLGGASLPDGRSQEKRQKGGAPAGAAPVVRVTTRLVQVDVIVHDSRGEPLTGLQQEDFLLFDRGEPQQVALFSMYSTGHGARGGPPAPPNTFSNRVEERSNAPTSVTVILLDELNTRFQDSAYARAESVKLLRQIQPQDRVALYLLRGDLRVLHDFTSDAAALLRALERHKSSDSAQLEASTPEAPNTGNEELDAWLEGANERMADFYTTNRVHRTVGAMEAIARHLARVAGRKNLIWISGSFPIWIGMDRGQIQGMLSRNRQNFASDVEQAGRALSDANIAVYPVDARGLIGAFGLNPNFNRPRFGAAGRPPDDPYGFGAIGDTHATMSMIAERTGGRAFYNTNDIQGSIRRAINDSRVTYVLGFYPTHQKWNGEFRSIKVQVKRPGAHLRHRQGYVASAAPADTPEGRVSAVRAAASSPLDAGAIGLTVQAMPAVAVGTETLVLQLAIAARDVSLTYEHGAHRGALEMVFLQRAADGATLARRDHLMNVELDAESLQQAQASGIQASKHLGLAPGAEELRIVVRDPATGALGSLRIPLRQVLPERASKAN